MDQILDRLYLGDFADAERVTISQCTCVITLCERPPVLTSAQIDHIHAPIPDEVWLPPYRWSELVHTVAQELKKRQTVLIHCRLGVSRSPSVVAAYLAQCGYRLEHALAYLVAQRSVVAPHAETWRGVVEWGQK
ncbi:MAG TPA: dual specificity protein phosphatase [Candidatus Tectomicrobia bacterium]